MIDYEFKSFNLWNMNSGTTIQLYPMFDVSLLEYNKNLFRRTISGQLNNYRSQLSGITINMPLTFVSSSDKSFIDDIWVNQDKCVFTLNNSDNPQSVVCRISNNIEPLQNRSPLQYDLFNGNLVLSSVDGYDITSGNPFILNDSIYGKLDQTYNILL